MRHWNGARRALVFLLLAAAALVAARLTAFVAAVVRGPYRVLPTARPQ